MTGMEIAKTAIDVLGPEIAVGVGGDYAHIDVRGQWARWTYLEDPAQAKWTLAELDAYRKRRAEPRLHPFRRRLQPGFASSG